MAGQAGECLLALELVESCERSAGESAGRLEVEDLGSAPPGVVEPLGE